jgi:hypothetical protein
MKLFYTKIFFLFVLLGLSFNLSAQEYIIVSGKVIDSRNTSPIPYAGIGLVGKPLGTVTNNNGSFDFKIPFSYGTDSLFVSCLGYSTYKVKVNDFMAKKSKIILLQPKVFDMKEVTIRPDKSDAYDIVKKAMDSLLINLPSKEFLMDCFYREYIMEDNTYKRAIEAAIEVYDDGEIHIGDYFYPSRIQGIRMGENCLGSFSKSESYNQLLLFLTSSLDLQWYLIKADRLKYTLDSMVFKDNKLIYAISAVPKKLKNKTYVSYESSIDNETSKLVRKKKKVIHKVEDGTDFFCKYQYYITSDKFAFVKIILFDTLYKPQIRNYVRSNGCFTSMNSLKKTIEFSPYDGKWYPKFISERKELGYYKKKDSLMFHNIVKYSDLMINDIKNTNVRKIKTYEQTRLYVDIYEQGYKMSKDFWNKYNFMPDDDLRKEVMQDIQIMQNEAVFSGGKVCIKVYDNDTVNESDDSLHIASKPDTNVVLSNKIPEIVNKDLFFTIQIYATTVEIPLDSKVFKDLKGVNMYYHKGMYKYTYGSESSLENALEMQKLLINYGYKGAFVVPFYKGQRITVDEAVNIINGNPQ